MLEALARRGVGSTVTAVPGAAPPALRVSVEAVRTAVAVVRAVGALDATTVPQVLTRVAALHRRGVDVVLDLSDVSVFADGGLDGLAGLLAAARARGRELRAVLCSRRAEVVVRAAGLDGVLPVSRTLPEAVSLVAARHRPDGATGTGGLPRPSPGYQ